MSQLFIEESNTISIHRTICFSHSLNVFIRYFIWDRVIDVIFDLGSKNILEVDILVESLGVISDSLESNSKTLFSRSIETSDRSLIS